MDLIFSFLFQKNERKKCYHSSFNFMHNQLPCIIYLAEAKSIMKVIKVNTAKTSMTCPRPSDIYCYTSCHIGIYIRTYIYTGHNIDRYLNSNYSVNYDSGEKIANQINCLYSYQNYLAMEICDSFNWSPGYIFHSR